MRTASMSTLSQTFESHHVKPPSNKSSQHLILCFKLQLTDKWARLLEVYWHQSARAFRHLLTHLSPPHTPTLNMTMLSARHCNTDKRDSKELVLSCIMSVRQNLKEDTSEGCIFPSIQDIWIRRCPAGAYIQINYIHSIVFLVFW